jgi:hypothetical protein
MPSSYTTKLRLEKQADGENENTWGQIVNRQFEAIEQAIAGLLELPLAGTDVTLTTNDGDLDQARNMMLSLTGVLSANVSVIIPSQPKLYVVLNDTTGDFDVTVKTLAGVGVVIPQGTIQLVACDGTDCGTLTDVAEAQNALELGGVAAATYARKDQGLPTDQIFTKAQGTQRSTLSISGGNVAVDASLSNCFKLTLTGNATLQNPTGSPVSGQTIRILVKQDGTGGRTVAFESKYKFPSGLAPTITAAAGSIDYLAFEYDADDDIWIGNALQALS